MNLQEELARITRGVQSEALLPSVRLNMGDSETFGEEAVRAAFRQHPLSLEGAQVVVSASAAAAFAGEEALVVDRYGPYVGRVWRLFPHELPREPHVDVAFDPDRHQQRGDVFARAADHPELSNDAFTALVEAGKQLVYVTLPNEEAPFRARAYLLRAFGTSQQAAGLFALHLLDREQEDRRASFSFAAVHLVDGAIAQVVRETEGRPRQAQRGWRPTFIGR